MQNNFATFLNQVRLNTSFTPSINHLDSYSLLNQKQIIVNSIN